MKRTILSRSALDFYAIICYNVSVFLCPTEGGATMAENSNKIKLLKLYELLQKDTDEDQPLSKTELCKRLTERGNAPLSFNGVVEFDG